MKSGSGKCIELTSDHLVYASEQWKEASTVLVNDALCSVIYDGRSKTGFTWQGDYVSEINHVLTDDTVYDLEIENTHCFFANELLVHNCIIGSSKIITPHGIKEIQDIVVGNKVLSYDFEKSCTVFGRVSAVARSHSTERCRVHTTGGNMVEATPEHLFYANGIWTAASSLVAGDNLLQSVPDSVQHTSFRGNEQNAARDNRIYMLKKLWQTHTKRKTRACIISRLYQLWKTYVETEGKNLQCGMSLDTSTAKIRERDNTSTPLRTMQHRFPAEEQHYTRKILLSCLQGLRSCPSDVARKESRMAAWMFTGKAVRTLGPSVSLRERKNKNTGQESMCCVLGRKAITDSSYRHGCYQQSTLQFGNSLQEMSREASCRRAFKATRDTVALVERVYEPAFVYDITVEGTHCFFADFDLIHNCIIDDPVKDRQEAESPVIQERVWDWYTSVLRTRLMPGASIVVCMTRWHPADLAGRLLEAMHSGGEQWDVVNLPALATAHDDPLGRALGEPLWPEWYDAEALKKIEAAIGSREWSSLYQQEPVTGSEFFSAASFLVDDKPVSTPNAVKFVFATVDTTQKGGKGRDGTAVSYWSLQELKIAGQYPLTLLDWDIVEHEGGLLDVWFPQVFQRLEELAVETRSREGSIGAFVEDKAAGSILLQQAPRYGWPMHAIDSKLTSVGKDARAINASGYINQGLVKINSFAFDKRLVFRGAMRNHWLSQMADFRIGQSADGGMDDLFDTATYACAIALGNGEGF